MKVVFDPNASKGIIPTEEFYDLLQNYGCRTSPHQIDKPMGSVKSLSNNVREDHLLRFEPEVGGTGVLVKISFKLVDKFNPDNLADTLRGKFSFYLSLIALLVMTVLLLQRILAVQIYRMMMMMIS